MASLIDQMNILKGLSDQSLDTEAKQPTGAVPPFLVLGEINRRKDMRQRYMGAMARQQPRTTVAQDLTSLAPPSGAAAGAGAPGTGEVGSQPGAPGAPLSAGIAAAPPTGYARGGIVGYADGGSIDYSGITTHYQDLLDRAENSDKTSRALALIAAGAGMAAGTSPYPLSNIGTGIEQGVNAYTGARSTADAQQLAALRGLTDIEQAQQTQANSDRSYGLDQQKFAASQDPNNFANQPTAIQYARGLDNLTPTQQDAADSFMHPYSTSSADNKAQSAFASLVKQYYSQLLAAAGGSGDPTALTAQATERAKKDFPQIFRQYGDWYTRNFGADATVPDAVTPPAPVDADPLGLGL